MNRIGIIAIVAATSATSLFGEEQIVLAPLFEYPVPPDELESLPARSDWMMENFWKPMDFGNRQPVEQARVNHAFEVYSVAMQWADRENVIKSVENLQKKLKKNPMLAVQFALAAEETLYGPRASFWIDEVYTRILDETLKIKKLPPHLRKRWTRQFETLVASEPGKKAPEFQFIDKDGQKQRYFAMSTPTLLVFADSKDPQTRLDLLRTETDTELTRLLTLGKLNILLIDPKAATGDFSSLPERWKGGKPENADALPYDIRLLPTIYAVGPDTKIISRQYSLPAALKEILPLCSDKGAQ